MTSDEPGAGLRSGQAAAFAGVTVRALSHYRRLGLVHPARNSSGYWRYSPADLATVVRIRALRELGLGLDEIGVLVAADAAADTFPDVLTSLRT